MLKRVRSILGRSAQEFVRRTDGNLSDSDTESNSDQNTTSMMQNLKDIFQALLEAADVFTCKLHPGHASNFVDASRTYNLSSPVTPTEVAQVTQDDQDIQTAARTRSPHAARLS